jgi:hypothetical protein
VGFFFFFFFFCFDYIIILYPRNGVRYIRLLSTSSSSTLFFFSLCSSLQSLLAIASSRIVGGWAGGDLMPTPSVPLTSFVRHMFILLYPFSLSSAAFSSRFLVPSHRSLLHPLHLHSPHPFPLLLHRLSLVLPSIPILISFYVLMVHFFCRSSVADFCILEEGENVCGVLSVTENVLYVLMSPRGCGEGFS